MAPAVPIAPILSRFWVDVWGICPALHELSATGAISRTPMVAARRARFTAVDLQEGFSGSRRPGARRASAYRHPQDGCREVRPVDDGPDGHHQLTGAGLG